MLCNNCGYQAPDEAKYCQECGNKLKIAGNPLTELNWATLPEKFSVEDLARFLGIPGHAAWNLSCKPRFPERNNIIKKDRLKDWFISTGWRYKPPPPPKPPAPPPAETVQKVDWTQVPAVLDAKEMMAIFGCGRHVLDVFTRHPAGIPHFRVGRSFRYKTEEVIKWAKQFKEPMSTRGERALWQRNPPCFVLVFTVESKCRRTPIPVVSAGPGYPTCQNRNQKKPRLSK